MRAASRVARNEDPRIKAAPTTVAAAPIKRRAQSEPSVSGSQVRRSLRARLIVARPKLRAKEVTPTGRSAGRLGTKLVGASRHRAPTILAAEMAGQDG